MASQAGSFHLGPFHPVVSRAASTWESDWRFSELFSVHVFFSKTLQGEAPALGK